MKTIFYGLAGEGLGHACRTQALLEHLDGFNVHLFTWGEAYDFFEKLKYPHLHRIIGVPFGRNKDKSIDLMRTVGNFIDYIKGKKESIRYVLNQARRYKPSLFISDFEGIVPRAGKQYNKPVLSIDNQHKFSRTDSKGLLFRLRFHAWFMGLYAEWVCPKPDFALVSTFYHSAVKKKHFGRTALVNCFMRKSIEDKKPTHGDYILVYYKVSVGDRMLQELWHTGEKVIVYNCPPEKRIAGLEYREISNEGFTEALAGCRCLFCSAGNQLLGEAIYYGKRIFAVPEPNQPEQEINAFYLQRMGHGMTCTLPQFDMRKVRKFIQEFETEDLSYPSNGVYEAVKVIEQYAKK